MNKNIIDKVAKIVEQACSAGTNIFGYGIWTHHITTVAELAKKWAPEFNADKEIVQLAAFLHDYASVKDEALYEEHHIHGPKEAEKILNELSYPQTKIEKVKEAIAKHRGSVQFEDLSPEAECLANADAASHIVNANSLLYLAYVQHGINIDEGAEWVKKKLIRSWGKMNNNIRLKLKNEYQAAILTLENKPKVNY